MTLYWSDERFIYIFFIKKEIVAPALPFMGLEYSSESLDYKPKVSTCVISLELGDTVSL